MGGEGQFDFCPELLELLTAKRLVGRSGRTFERLDCLSTVNSLVVLHNLCRIFGPERTLEVGLGFGASCLAIAGSHRELGRRPARQHFAIDPFQTAVWDDVGVMLVERAGLREYFNFRASYSCLELPKLICEGLQFELVYIDGSHLFEDVLVDFYFTARLLAHGGIVVFDDSTDLHVKKVLRFIRANLASAFEGLDLAPFRADKGQALRYRLARRLGGTQLTAFRRIGSPEREWNAPLVDF